MPLLHIIVLALVQGITEFLPISSSGHLVLVHAALETQEQNWQNHILMDVAVHIGTLFAVLIYFRADVFKMLLGAKNILTGQTKTPDSKLLLMVILGSIPVILAGFVLNMLAPDALLSLHIIAWTTLIFGIILWIADQKSPQSREIKDMTFRDVLIIGFAQALALIPGTSRSGITMTAGRFLGFTRTESAHYSLLLGMVAITGAGVLSGITMLKTQETQLTYDIALAAALAFLTGYAAIALMMKWLERASFTPFAIYRIVMGLGLLTYLYWPQ